MRIHCDNCGVEFDKDTAIAVESDGEVFYLCSARCCEDRGHPVHDDPGRGDDQSTPSAEAEAGI